MKPFDSPDKTIGNLKAASAGNLIAAAADIALVIDRKGIVKDVAFTSDDLAASFGTEWVGEAWLDIVTPESRKKAEDLLEPSSNDKPMRWRQVNHAQQDHPDVPVRYTSVSLGSAGKVLVLGQDLRPQAAQQQRIMEAQAAMEREYERLRHAETRYRAVFQVSSEAVLIVDAATQRVVEANPAASQFLANGSRAISGRHFSDLFSNETSAAAQESLVSAQTMPRVEGVPVESAHGNKRLSMSVSLVRQSRSAYFLVRLSTQGSAANAADLVGRSNVLKAIDQLPDGLVIVDKDRRIMMANPSFLELCELAQESQVKGEPVERWLGRVSVDVDVLLAHVREHGATRRFSTVVRGEYGGRSEVEISAVYISGPEAPYYALSLRQLEVQAARQADTEKQLPRSVEQLTKLVGRVPLKELVRETTDIVERLCIEAALDLTSGNRASAAEMLGLSRQSFYVKLRRHGLGELDGTEHEID